MKCIGFYTLLLNRFQQCPRTKTSIQCAAFGENENERRDALRVLDRLNSLFALENLASSFLTYNCTYKISLSQNLTCLLIKALGSVLKYAFLNKNGNLTCFLCQVGAKFFPVILVQLMLQLLKEKNSCLTWRLVRPVTLGSSGPTSDIFWNGWQHS